MTTKFPVGVWGTIVASIRGDERARRVRIDVAPSESYLIVTEEPAGTFDVWVECAEDVMAYLDELTIEWTRS